VLLWLFVFLAVAAVVTQHASSRPVLGRRVERLGLRPPSGGEMKVLPLPADAGR
jgi:hypothetical protein